MDNSAEVGKSGRFFPSAVGPNRSSGGGSIPRWSLTAQRNLCSASEIALGRLHRDVPKEEPDVDDIVISSCHGGGVVAQFVVRNLEDDIADELKRRAKRNGRSMEDEVRHILRSSVQSGRSHVRKLGSRISQRFRRVGLSADLPELRGQPARAADVDS